MYALIQVKSWWERQEDGVRKTWRRTARLTPPKKGRSLFERERVDPVGAAWIDTSMENARNKLVKRFFFPTLFESGDISGVVVWMTRKDELNYCLSRRWSAYQWNTSEIFKMKWVNDDAGERSVSQESSVNVDNYRAKRSTLKLIKLVEGRSDMTTGQW